jgi:cell division transport system permease protein
MTWSRALLYFLREAAVNALRGWRVSVLAVLTIAVSLFVGGAFLQIGENLGRVIESWRRQARLVVYLRPGTTPAALAELRSLAGQPQWVVGVEEVNAAEAEARFRAAFPSLGDLLEGWDESPLPASFEVAIDAAQARSTVFEAWVEQLRGHSAAAMVDDDRDWLGELEVIIVLVRGVGLVLGAVLLGAAVFTIASVVRLTAYLHSEEIAILRLVGGTEFFIRGPFYVEGLLQGLAGGTLAAGALLGARAALRPQVAESLLAWILVGEEAGGALLLVGLPAVGALAGLLGAVASLRRESLGATLEA